MTEGNEFHPPKIYAIWVDARPESPMAGLSGFLSENSRRLFFTERGDAELKIRDMEALRLNRHPAAEYRCVEYPGGYDAERSIQAELLKTISLQADPEIMRYEVTDRIYGNTGGGCMVGTLAVRLPDLDRITVNGVAVGPIKGEYAEPAVEKNAGPVLGVKGTGADVANAVMYLADPAVFWNTGEIIDLNGGRFAI